jgi:CheY-like chemotaxis protein
VSANAAPAAGTGILLSDDLIFSSRITGTAQSLGVTIRVARSADALVTIARQQPPRLVILDLANPGLSVPELIARLRAAVAPMPLVVAYGSHVDAEGLRAARAAGCDIVWPRSKFVEELPRVLPEWMEKPRG